MSLIAWAAGFADGEGCFQLYTQKEGSGWLTPRFYVTNTHIQSVYRFRDIVKCGTIIPVKRRSKKWKDAVTLETTGDSALKVCHLLVNFLFTKRRQAEIILEFSQLPIEYEVFQGKREFTLEIYTKRLVLLDEIKELNKKGRNIEI